MTWLDTLSECDTYIALMSSDQFFRDAKCMLQHEEAVEQGKYIVIVAGRRVEIPADFKYDVIYRFDGPEDMPGLVQQLAEHLNHRFPKGGSGIVCAQKPK